MKGPEENLNEQNTPYQCNFIILPREEKTEEQSETLEPREKRQLLLT